MPSPQIGMVKMLFQQEGNSLGSFTQSFVDLCDKNKLYGY